MASVISFNNKAWLSAESPRFDCKAARSASSPLGVALFGFQKVCTSFIALALVIPAQANL
jgi:hypothetical protein